MTGPKTDETTRRELFQSTGRLAAASALAGVAIPHVHAGEDNTIRLAIVGCGGRGTGAVGNALSVPGEHGQADRHGRPVPGSPRRLVQAAQGPVRAQARRPARPAIPGLRRVPQGDRLPEAGRRRAPDHARRVPADTPGIRRGEGGERLHGEDLRPRPGRREAGPRAPGRRPRRRTSRSPPG